ncbi:MAG: hypothetical protein HYU39_10950 [Thaumarchaeota archaeon]|nr:hypothetical protein [Nitrososphaerota archaeon]
MSESPIHKAPKETVARDLNNEGYRVFFEPLYSPLENIDWRRYHPDLLAVRKRPEGEDIVVVECETKPNIRRLESKNLASLRIQSKLFHQAHLRRILVIPAGRLGSLDLKVRREWEIWIVEKYGKPMKIPVIHAS